MKSKSLYSLCRNDIYLAAAIIVFIAALFAVFSIVKGKSEGNKVIITIAGETYGTYSLNTDETIEIVNKNGRNTVVIENNQVKMNDADCPDQYCVSSGTISKNGETIVCLPHKLVVEVSVGESSDQEIDAVVR